MRMTDDELQNRVQRAVRDASRSTSTEVERVISRAERRRRFRNVGLAVTLAAAAVGAGGIIATGQAGGPAEEQVTLSAEDTDDPSGIEVPDLGFWETLPDSYAGMNAAGFFPNDFESYSEMAAAADAVLTAEVVEVRQGRTFGESGEGLLSVHYAEIVLRPSDGIKVPEGSADETVVIEIPLPARDEAEAAKALEELRRNVPTGRALYLLRSNAAVAEEQGLGEKRVAEEEGYWHPIVPEAIVVELADGKALLPFEQAGSPLSRQTADRTFESVVQEARQSGG